MKMVQDAGREGTWSVEQNLQIKIHKVDVYLNGNHTWQFFKLQ